MIGKLTGTIDAIGMQLLLNVHDVGYAVWITEPTRHALHLGERVSLYTHTHVREDALELFGFLQESELKLFQLLLTVSGIGPKTSLAIVGRGADEVTHAVQTADVDFFTTIPRLGKKNAQKIIIELKQKLGSLAELDVSGETTGETRQLLDALESMGYKRFAIVEAMKSSALEGLSIEQKIKRLIQLL